MPHLTISCFPQSTSLISNTDDTFLAQSLESVLQNLNKLNRALEEVIAVGNEFSPVEALWSHFENVMATRGEEEGGEGGGEGEKGDGEETVHGAEGEDEERSGK